MRVTKKDHLHFAFNKQSLVLSFLLVLLNFLVYCISLLSIHDLEFMHFITIICLSVFFTHKLLLFTYNEYWSVELTNLQVLLLMRNLSMNLINPEFEAHVSFVSSFFVLYRCSNASYYLHTIVVLDHTILRPSAMIMVIAVFSDIFIIVRLPQIPRTP